MPCAGQWAMLRERVVPSRTGIPHLWRATHPLVGWLTSGWEGVDPRAAGRPQRRYYRLTPRGTHEAHQALTRSEAARTRLLTRLAPSEELP